MALREDITAAMKAAMKAKDSKRLGTLRLILAAIKDKDIASRTDGERTSVSEDDVLALLAKLVKSREDSIAMYEKGGRQDLVDAEKAEIEVIKEFMPKQMSAEEAAAAIDAAIAETGASAMKDMGKVMGALKAKYTGVMDFASASKTIKARLSA